MHALCMLYCPPALQYGLAHISVGDLLRAEVAAGTPAGKKAKSFMDNGDLVPNEVSGGGDGGLGMRMGPHSKVFLCCMANGDLVRNEVSSNGTAHGS
jgi:hypothetical protein